MKLKSLLTTVILMTMGFICVGALADSLSALQAEILAKGQAAIDASGEAAKNSFEVRLNASITNNEVAFGEIVHKESGLICGFWQNENVSTTIYHVDGNGKPDDVGCETNGPFGAVNFYAYRRPNSSIEQQLEFAITPIMMREPNAELYQDSPLIWVRRSGQKPSDNEVVTGTLAKAFALRGQAPTFPITSVWVGKHGDWYIKMRSTHDSAFYDRSGLEWVQLWRKLRPDAHLRDMNKAREKNGAPPLTELPAGVD